MADAGDDAPAAVQSRAELEANLAEYQSQLEQVRVALGERETGRNEGEKREKERKSDDDASDAVNGETSTSSPNDRSTPSSRRNRTTRSTSSSSRGSSR